MTSAALPLCFVLMPFGRKPGLAGAGIDFDAVYATRRELAVLAHDQDTALEASGSALANWSGQRLPC